MGIDFSHGEACWAYSGFMRFRSRLAEELGYVVPLREMYNDGSYVCMEREDIYPLINHSDCDGNLTPAEMLQIIPQLMTIVSKWEDDDYDKQRGLQLIEGMEDAIATNEDMEFC